MADCVVTACERTGQAREKDGEQGSLPDLISLVFTKMRPNDGFFMLRYGLNAVEH